VSLLIKIKLTQLIKRTGKSVPTQIWERSYYGYIIRNEKDFLEKAKY